jgi:hypothetical protein
MSCALGFIYIIDFLLNFTIVLDIKLVLKNTFIMKNLKRKTPRAHKMMSYLSVYLSEDGENGECC